MSLIRKLIILLVLACPSIAMSQTLIATSAHPEATANHNQRKIVRDTDDNVYVVLVDSLDGVSIIKGVKYDREMAQWEPPVLIALGSDPSIAISKDNIKFLVYETLDTLTRIECRTALDFIDWSDGILLSDTAVRSHLPIADTDSTGGLNCFWIASRAESQHDLVYRRMAGDSLSQVNVVLTDSAMEDIAIASHLEYLGDDILFGVQLPGDSLMYGFSQDYMATYDTIYEGPGVKPCISHNTGHYENRDNIRLLHILDQQLIEIETHTVDLSEKDIHTLYTGDFDELCINNLAPDAGYSFLYTENGRLFHCFSYGMLWGRDPWFTKMDSLGTDVVHPSIAYKQFRYGHVDFVWMEGNGNKFNIFHKRAEKHRWVGIEDHETGKGFTLTGYPNPFRERITIEVKTMESGTLPSVRIFGMQSRLLNELKPSMQTPNHFIFDWDGTDQGGSPVEAGVYLVQCISNNARTARKVLLVK